MNLIDVTVRESRW